MTAVQTPVLDELLEFLITSPTLEQVIALRPSDAAQQRVSYLLEQNRNGHLTELESRELDEFLQVEHLVRMLKIKAQQKLNER